MEHTFNQWTIKAANIGNADRLKENLLSRNNHKQSMNNIHFIASMKWSALSFIQLTQTRPTHLPTQTFGWSVGRKQENNKILWVTQCVSFQRVQSFKPFGWLVNKAKGVCTMLSIFSPKRLSKPLTSTNSIWPSLASLSFSHFRTGNLVIGRWSFPFLGVRPIFRVSREGIWTDFFLQVICGSK